LILAPGGRVAGIRRRAMGMGMGRGIRGMGRFMGRGGIKLALVVGFWFCFVLFCFVLFCLVWYDRAGWGKAG
jgi:hypothetical protein